MRYYREYKDGPEVMTEVSRETVVMALETRGYYSAGTVSSMEAEARKGLFPFCHTPWAIYSVKDN